MRDVAGTGPVHQPGLASAGVNPPTTPSAGDRRKMFVAGASPERKRLATIPRRELVASTGPAPDIPHFRLVQEVSNIFHQHQKDGESIDILIDRMGEHSEWIESLRGTLRDTMVIVGEMRTKIEELSSASKKNDDDLRGRLKTFEEHVTQQDANNEKLRDQLREDAKISISQVAERVEQAARPGASSDAAQTLDATAVDMRFIALEARIDASLKSVSETIADARDKMDKMATQGSPAIEALRLRLEGQMSETAVSMMSTTDNIQSQLSWFSGVPKKFEHVESEIQMMKNHIGQSMRVSGAGTAAEQAAHPLTPNGSRSAFPGTQHGAYRNAQSAFYSQEARPGPPQPPQMSTTWESMPPQPPGTAEWEMRAPSQRPPESYGQRSRLEDKTAVSDNMKFPDSKKEQLKWIKTTSNYFIGKHPELKEMLDWVELFQANIVTSRHIALLRNSPWVRETDPAKLSEDIWSYLNLVMAKATNKAAFENADASNGFDAWRRIVVPLGPRSEERMHEMHRDVTYPTHSKSLHDLEADLDRWEADLEEYYRCGGEAMMPKTKLMTAKNFIPKGTNPAVHLAVKNCASYEEFRRDLRATVTYLSDRGAIGSQHAHLVEKPPENEDSDAVERPGPAEWETLPMPDEFPSGTFPNQQARDNYVLVMSRFAQRRQKAGNRKQQSPQAPTRARAPPRDARDIKCANCNQTGHTAQACSRPALPTDQRKCHTCNKTGHLSRNCPENKKANLVASQDGERAAIFMVRDENHTPGRPVTLGEAVIKPTGSQRDKRQLARDQRTLEDLHNDPPPPPPQPEGSERVRSGGKEAGEQQTRRVVRFADTHRCSGACSRGSCAGQEGTPEVVPPPHAGQAAWPSLAESNPSGQRDNPSSLGLGRILSQYRVPDDAVAPNHMSPIANSAGADAYSGSDEGPMLPVTLDEGHNILPVEQWRDTTVDVTLDSGACTHILDIEDAPGYAVQESPGSRRGHNFVVGNGHRVPNEGQVQLNMEAPSSDTDGRPLRVQSTFQVAEITRPLMSVSSICDQGHSCVFTKEKAQVLDAAGKELCSFKRENGLYVASMKLRPPSPFVGQAP